MQSETTETSAAFQQLKLRYAKRAKWLRRKDVPVRRSRWAGADAQALDPDMSFALEPHVLGLKRALHISLTLPSNFSPQAEGTALANSLEALVARITRKTTGLRTAGRLQSLFVLERPQRKFAIARKLFGDYNAHVHGMIEIPGDFDGDYFEHLVWNIWTKSQFKRPINTLGEESRSLKWLKYMSKPGSVNPRTGLSTWNTILYDSIRPRKS